MTTSISEIPEAICETILLIEDERPTSGGLQSELSSRGFKVQVAATASQASSLLSGFAFSAIVVDLILPDDEHSQKVHPGNPHTYRLTGMEIIRRIRRGEFADGGTPPKVPIFVLTCVLEESTSSELEKLGIVQFWSKPLGLAVVAERVKLFFQNRPELRTP
jgi:DNA-binding response OmpR family regulator